MMRAALPSIFGARLIFSTYHGSGARVRALLAMGMLCIRGRNPVGLAAVLRFPHAHSVQPVRGCLAILVRYIGIGVVPF